jgi:Flp pilus assembly protein CpaB
MPETASPPPSTTPDWESSARRRVPFYLVTALLLAILAAALTYSYLEDVRAAAVPTGKAVVALQDIRPGTAIEEAMVEVRDVPEAALPPQRLTSESEVVGHLASVPLAPGEVLLPSKISGGPEFSLSSRLPDGRWAMVLPPGWMISPVPELAPGDRIELLTYQAGQLLDEASIVVSAVEVLQFSGAPGDPGQLTLAVTLDEAISILYARVNGFSLLPLLRPQGE